jgi:selenoprotein W-related protein
LAAELLQELEGHISEITLVPSEGGRFEVSVGENLVFSKLKNLRHPDAGEVLKLVRSALAG